MTRPDKPGKPAVKLFEDMDAIIGDEGAHKKRATLMNLLSFRDLITYLLVYIYIYRERESPKVLAKTKRAKKKRVLSEAVYHQAHRLARS